MTSVQGFEWGNIVLLFGSFTAIVIALGTALKGTEHNSNYFLVAFLFVCAVGIILKFLDQTRNIESYPGLLRLNHPVGLLRPPLFFLYVYYVLRDQRIDLRQLLHLLPSVFMLVFVALGRLPNWFGIVGLVYSTLYLVLSAMQYRSLGEQQGLPAGLKRWIKLLLLGYAVFLVTAVTTYIFDPSRSTSYIIYQVLSLLIIVVCARLLQFPSTKRVAVKYGKSALSELEKSNYMNLIRTKMAEGEPFTKEAFRLADLAKSVELSEHIVSQVINEQAGMSFSDFVNQFRVEKVKQLLADPKYSHLTLESIGMEAGFNSKASFYSAFKRLVGITPGEFQKSSIKSH